MKYMKAIANLVIAVGVMIIAGTAGTSDMGGISAMEAVSMVLLGFSVISFGKMLKAVSELNFKKGAGKRNVIKLMALEKGGVKFKCDVHRLQRFQTKKAG